MKIKVKIENGQISFGNEKRTEVIKEILRKNEGEYFNLVHDNRESAKMRRFFEGAVVPYYFFQNPKSGWKNFAECRESLKLEHHFTFVNNRYGESQKVAKSTMVNRESFSNFLEKIERDFNENGFEWPDHKAFKAWEDSAPKAGEVYPPLLKLKEKYELWN